MQECFRAECLENQQAIKILLPCCFFVFLDSGEIPRLKLRPLNLHTVCICQPLPYNLCYQSILLHGTFKPLQWLQPPCQLLACLLACKTFPNFPLGKIWVLTCQLADILIEKEMCPNDYNQPCTVRLSGYSKNPKTGPMIGPQKGRGYVGPSNKSQITAKSWMMKTDKRFMPWKDPFFLILFIFLFCRRYLWPHKGGFISI